MPAAELLRPLDASADGWRIDRLIDRSVVIAAVVAAIALGYLVWAALRWRSGGSRVAATRGASWRGGALAVAVTTLVFAAIDLPLLVTSLRDLRGTFAAVAAAEREPGSVRVEINAQRWAWNVRHAGLDATFATDDDVVELNQLRLPLGRPAVIQLASSDVIHALFLPAFRVKLDAVPGRIHATWFRPVVAGESEIACAQHCGVHHHLMRGVVTVMPEDEFDRWHAAASRDARRIAAEDARAVAEEPTRERPAGVEPLEDPAAARRWGWPWRHGGGR